MYICFVEYTIEPVHRSVFEAWIGPRKEAGGFTIYEGTDQPGLYVEIWEAKDEAAAGTIKKERCDERSSWGTMFEWVPGGAGGIHAWVFRQS